MRTGLFMTAVALIGCGDDVGSDDALTDDDQLEVDAPVQIDAAIDADETPLAVTIQFRPTVGTAPFACGLQYLGQGSDSATITPKDFRVYYYDVELISAAGARVPVALDQDTEWQVDNVGLLDFEDFTAGCQDGTPATNPTIRGTVPPGEYTGIAFEIGVPEEMNHTDLTAKPAPLNTSGLWWSWNLGHIFMAAVSTTQVGDVAVDHYVHMGSTGCTGDATLGQPVVCTKANRAHIELTNYDVLERAVIVDYGAILAGSPLAIADDNCHSFTADTCTEPFSKVGVNFATGQPMAGQSVFRIEQ